MSCSDSGCADIFSASRWQVGKIVGEQLDVLLRQRLRRHRHAAVEIGGRLRLEAAKLLEEVLLLLAGQSWNVLLAHQRRRVTGAAEMLLDQALAGLGRG